MAAALDEQTASKVVRQVEFYFSDSNLPRDKFLKRCVQESEDERVSLGLICSFKRMKEHLALKEDVGPDNVPEETVAAVAEVLRKSAPTVQLSDDGKRVGRVNKLLKPEEVLEQVDSRTIAASPLPYDVKLEDVEQFFSQHGKVNSVRLPRHVVMNKAFCGSALIEFSSEEEANAIYKSNLVYAGADLEIKSKKDFDAERRSLIEEINSGEGLLSKRDGAPMENNNHPKGLIISFTLRKLSQQDSSEQNDSDPMAPNQNSEVATVHDKSTEATNKDNSSDATNESKSPEADSKESEEKITREDIKLTMKKYGIVKYVDYTMGGDSGYIRFEQAEEAQKARTAAVLSEEGGLIVKNYVAALEAVEGDAERDYWAKLRGGQERVRGIGGNSRGRGGHGRGGRHSYDRRNSFNRENKHKRFGDGVESGKSDRSSKVMKLEDKAEATACEASKAVEAN